MARELKGLAAGLAAGLGVVAVAYGVSAVATRGQTPEPKHMASAAGTAVASSQIVITGMTLYKDSCAGCHGAAAQGGGIGPSLHHLGDPDAKIAANIKRGYSGRMPGFKDQYNDTQINALLAYLQTLE